MAFYKNLLTDINENYKSLCFYFDLKTTFDVLNIQELLDKLERYGIRGNCN